MAIDYQNLRNWVIPDQRTRYGVDDCIRYALSLGMGADPLDEADLRYVVEGEGMRVMPTWLACVGAPGAWATDPGTGIDWMQILHGEHRASDAATGQLLATVEHVSFCRADGGFASAQCPGDTAPEALPAVPERAPDAVLELPTLPGAALLYRLNGDRNPIHAWPSAARVAGFDRPILHGLCTYGMAARALVRMACGGDGARLASIATRFSSPVWPGDTLSVRLWTSDDHGGDQNGHSSSNRLQFAVWAKERDRMVLSHGLAEVRPASATETAGLADAGAAHVAA